MPCTPRGCISVAALASLALVADGEIDACHAATTAKAPAEIAAQIADASDEAARTRWGRPCPCRLASPEEMPIVPEGVDRQRDSSWRNTPWGWECRCLA